MLLEARIIGILQVKNYKYWFRLLQVRPIWKKALGETQTLRAGRSRPNAEPKIFTPPQTPFQGAQDRQNLISWRWSLPAPIDARNFELSW